MKTAKRMKRLLGWLLVCLPVAAGAQSVQDSLAIAAIRWDTCCVRPHLVAVQAQLELFGAPQAISMVRYDAGRYRTRIVQPDSLTLTSVLAEAEGAVAAVNAGYFNVKTLVPSTFVRVGGRTVAATEAREEFRVNGVVAIKGRRVRIEPYVPRGSRGVTVTRWLPGRCFSAAARRCRMPIARAVSGAGTRERSWASRDGARR